MVVLLVLVPWNILEVCGNPWTRDNRCARMELISLSGLAGGKDITMRDKGNAMDVFETAHVGMEAASTSGTATQGTTSEIVSDKFACDDIGADDASWECACTLVHAYRCGTDGVAKLSVCVRLDLDSETGSDSGNTDDNDEATDGDAADTCAGVNAGSCGRDGHHIRTGYVRARLRDPRIGLTSTVEHPLRVSEANGRHVTAEGVVHDVMQSFIPDDRDDVIAWVEHFSNDAMQQTLRRYGDWWRRCGAREAIRTAVDNDARVEIDQCDTYRFPMKAHTIVYLAGGEVFEAWAQLDRHVHATVTRG